MDIFKSKMWDIKNSSFLKKKKHLFKNVALSSYYLRWELNAGDNSPVFNSYVAA